MAITDLTGTKWLLEQGWTATSGFGQSLSGEIYDTSDSLDLNQIDFFNIGYSYIVVPYQQSGLITPLAEFVPEIEPKPYSNNILVNSFPTILTPTYYYEFEITGGTDVTNTTLINWLETNATLVYPLTPAITKIYKGDVERSDIQKIYKGTTLLYEKVMGNNS